MVPMLFMIIYIIVLVLIVTFLVRMIQRFVEAHEAIARSMQEVARNTHSGNISPSQNDGAQFG
jgi:hypothetical protein